MTGRDSGRRTHGAETAGTMGCMFTSGRMPFPRMRLPAVALAFSIAGPGVAADREVEMRGAGLFDNGVIPAHVRVDMRRLPPLTRWRPGDPIKEIPQRKGVPRDFAAPPTAPQPEGADRLRALDHRITSRSGGRAFDSPLIEQPGGGFSGVNPPDTVGDVGNDYYIQMINGSSGTGGTRVLILAKDDGSEAASFLLGGLAEGSGTGCTDGAGDPIVMFDPTADNGPDEPPGRWFLSEFTDASLCVYISETADPMAGAWYVYEFASDSGAMPDYPKYGVWPDAYYIGANEDGDTFASPGRLVYALDRENMLQGLTTRPTQVFEVPLLAGFGFQMLHPVDWDGNRPPPSGAPGLFVRHRDDEVHDASSADPTRDFLEIWEFAVDWDSPADSTFSGPISIGVADFESELCGLTVFACVPQPDPVTLLDPLREPMMWRVQYRNFGTHQTLVGSWVSDVVGGSGDLHGVRWAELNDTGFGWELFQQGTVSPDSVHRWMPSIAMDVSGNIAVGYNVSDGSSVFPGLRYAGRLVDDPLDTMPRGEFSLVEGSAANASNRYGDYSSMTVDPVDGCTFWFTGQYNPSSQWSTWIGAFRFDACGDPAFRLVADETAGGVCTRDSAATFETAIDVLAFNGFSDEVELELQFPVAGMSGALAPNPALPGEVVAGEITVEQSVAAGDYDVTLVGRSAGVEEQSLGLALGVFDALPGPLAPALPEDTTTHVLARPTLSWSAADGAERYRVEIATDAGFADIVHSAEVGGTSHRPASPLAFDTEHFWRVVPINQCGEGSATTTLSFTTMPAPGDCPAVLPVESLFADDMEGGSGGWMLGAGSVENTWAQITDDTDDNGTVAWNAGDMNTISDQRLVSPRIELPGREMRPLTLRFGNRQELESDGASACWDAAVLEITDDDGENWALVGGDSLLFRAHDGIINSGSSNPLSGLPGWCGDPRGWEDYEVDLSGYSGQSIRLRFRVGTDEAVGRQVGWSVDDVRVEACATELLFNDGFEP